VNVEDLWGAAGIEWDVSQHGQRAQPLAVRLELLTGVPDLAHTQVPFRTEADVLLKTVRKSLNSSLSEPPVSFVVLLGR
jgi:hypothetical protein